MLGGVAWASGQAMALIGNAAQAMGEIIALMASNPAVYMYRHSGRDVTYHGACMVCLVYPHRDIVK